MDAFSSKRVIYLRLLVVLSFLFLPAVFTAKVLAQIPNTPPPAQSFFVCPTGYTGPLSCNFYGGDGIQQAIDAAPMVAGQVNGAEVIIRPGNYTRQTATTYTNKIGKLRNVFIHTKQKNIVLNGEPGAKISGTGAKMSGIAVTGGTATVRGLIITGFQRGDCVGAQEAPCSDGDIILTRNDATLILENNLIVNNNAEEGVIAYNNSHILSTNNTYTQNSVAGTIYATGQSRIASRNDILAFNPGAANYMCQETAIIDLAYSLSHNPSATDFWKVHSSCALNGQAATLTTDPKFISPSTGDFQLQLNSPAVDSGDPQILDVDKSRSDMGAFGGPNAFIDYPPVGFSELNGSVAQISGVVYDADVNSVLPVKNNSFENGTFGWTRSNDINAADFQAFSCATYPPCAIEDKFLKVTYANDNVSPNDPWVVSDWIDVGQAVNNMSFRLKMLVKSHSSNVKLLVGLQRYPKGGTDWANTYRTLDPLTIVPADRWMSWLEDATFDTLAGYAETKVRIVLRPSTKLDGSGWAAQPLYYDNIILEQISPVRTNSVTDKRIRLDIYDVGADKTLTTGDTQLAQVYSTISTDYTNGQFSYALPASVKDGQTHYLQVWAINKTAKGTNVGTVNGQFVNKNITLGKYFTFNSAQITPVQTTTPTVTPTPYINFPPAPACPAGKPARSTGNANCDDAVDLLDFEIWRQEFTGTVPGNLANFNNDPNDKVDLLDFEIWRHTLTVPVSTPTPTNVPAATVTPTRTPTPTTPPVAGSGAWLRCDNRSTSCNAFCTSKGYTCGNDSGYGLKEIEVGYSWSYGSCSQTTSPTYGTSSSLSSVCNIYFNSYCYCAGAPTPTNVPAATVTQTRTPTPTQPPIGLTPVELPTVDPCYCPPGRVCPDVQCPL